MYEENEAGFVLRGIGDSHPVLAGVHAEGRLDGPLFTLTLRQTYRNLSTRTLEVAYTFPLAHGAVLLGLAAHWAGRRLDGRVLSSLDAEQQYEGALADGDLPILLEAGAGDLLTANIGNLQPGEQVVLEVRTAQWLAAAAGRLRVTLPTTIAPRAGSADGAGLLPHQVPPISMQADYPLALNITVAGALMSSSIECPTHALAREKSAAGIVLTLAASARLDRDVVLLITPRAPRTSTLLCADDGSGQVAMAAFQLPAGSPRPRIALRLLVDCSGSMAGDAIDSARLALMAIGNQLRSGDSVSLSRYGSNCELVLPPSRVSPDIGRRLQTHLADLRADMGGTDLQAALAAVFELPIEGDGSGADVLLITDGQVWDASPLVRAARASAHRLFAIGVGSTPAESVLREVASASGGACEFVTPSEGLHDATLRMMDRIRQQPWVGLRVDWGRTPAWEVAPPTGAFGTDTLFAFAGFDPLTSTAGCAVRDGAAALTGPARLTGRDSLGSEAELACTDMATLLPGDTLARMAGARRLGDASDGRAHPLALEHQLLSTQTHGVLVHNRDDRDKAGGPAGWHRVGTMLGAGWGGLGRIQPGAIAPAPSLGEPPVHRPAPPGAAAAASCAATAMTAETAVMSPMASLREMMDAIALHLAHGGSLQGLLVCCTAFDRIQPIELAMHRVLTLRLSPAAAWLLLGCWVARRGAGQGDHASAALLAAHAAFIDKPTREQALEIFEARLGRYSSAHWEARRSSRASDGPTTHTP
jgi:Ca-activated chloride channel homolog